MTDVKLMLGNCLDRLKDLDDNSVDSIVTDPPYGIDFMGKKWDYDVPSTEIWEQAIRVLKPGGYLLAFAGTRTQHRMAVRIEDAGFEIRDMIAWVYGSGFPKSHNISKSIDKMAGAEREVVGIAGSSGSVRNAMAGDFSGGEYYETKSTTDDAKKWEGWGTALKPALEPITVARKPLEEKTVAKNVLKYGTGGINIDASRIPTNPDDENLRPNALNHNKTKGGDVYSKYKVGAEFQTQDNGYHNTEGRFPANFIHDGSEEVTSAFPHSKSGLVKEGTNQGFSNGGSQIYGASKGVGTERRGSEGSAARFFYVPKTSKKDRNDGMTNNHPTVKPTDLMRYLVTMVTPKGGTTLDPFMGSGSTGRGAKLGGFNFIGIELDENYLEIAKARIDVVSTEVTLGDFL